METDHKPELLAPAGDLEKLKIAVAYGADAVYIGGERYGLRAKARNFDMDAMAEGIAYAHAHGVKVYVTANVYAHDGDLAGMPAFFKAMAAIGADALIVSDPGVFTLARKTVPDMALHISTQANTTNTQSVLFWHGLGAERVILARELTMAEIAAMRGGIPDDCKLEVFVHGAMCMAVSGRCFLSRAMTGRSANDGACAHPCRYDYYVTEATRPDEHFPVTTGEDGFAVFDARDLCMVAHIPALVRAGVHSFKIEGRMKSAFYVGTAVKAYRQAIDDWWADPALYTARIPDYRAALQRASHRGDDFSTGFYFDTPGTGSAKPYTQTYAFLGIVRGYDEKKKVAVVEQRGKFSVSDTVTFIRARAADFTQIVTGMWSMTDEALVSAPHARQLIKVATDRPVAAPDIVCGVRCKSVGMEG